MAAIADPIVETQEESVSLYSGGVAFASDAYYSLKYGAHILKDEAVFSEIMQDWILEAEAIEFYVSDDSDDTDYVHRGYRSSAGVWNCACSGDWYGPECERITTAYGSTICRSSYDDEYGTCEGCDRVFTRDDLDGDCECDSCRSSSGSHCRVVRETFSVTLNKKVMSSSREGRGRNRTEIMTVALPKDSLTDEAIKAIKSYVNSWFATFRSEQNEEFQDRNWLYEDSVRLGYKSDNGGRPWDVIDWTLGKGKPSIVKRISKLFYGMGGVRMAPSVLTEIGNIASRESSSRDEYKMFFVRDFDNSAEAFTHGGSCWWESYYQGRCLLKHYKSFGMLMDSGDIDEPSGRCWSLAVKVENDRSKLTPIIIDGESMDSDTYFVFNAYGDDLIVWARLLAQLKGMTYKKVEVSDINGNVYINRSEKSGRAVGYIVGSQETISNLHDSYDIRWSKQCSC